MTIRLFDQDVNRTDFTAAVLACEEKDGQFLVTLDQTAFFPEGGGQGADHGTLGEARVLDAHDVGGVILHTVDRPLTPGTTVEGRVDWTRRLSMMQQHTGEHILSGLICRERGYRNVGFHIGTEAVTLDFSGPLTWEDIRRAERRANEIVWRDVPVRAWVPGEEELAALDYRSKKAIDGDVRIVHIEGADTCACCGTHVERTGSVGQIKVIGAMNYKGGVRLSILCGMRALDHENIQQDENHAISQALSAKPGELTQGVQRLLDERDSLKARCDTLGQRVFTTLLNAERGRPVRVLVADMLASAQHRKAAAQLAEGGRYGLILAPREAGWSFVLSSPAEDVRPAAAALCQRFGGKGGGPRDMSQGILQSGDPEAFREALEAL